MVFHITNIVDYSEEEQEDNIIKQAEAKHAVLMRLDCTLGTQHNCVKIGKNNMGELYETW